MRIAAQSKKPALQDAPADWHKADIKAALEKAGWTIRKLADAYEICESTLRAALNGRYPLSQQRIANALGIRPQQIWPSRYDASGRAVGRRAASHEVSARAATNRSRRTTRGRDKGVSSN